MAQQTIYNGSECFENLMSCMRTLVFSEDLNSELPDWGLSGITLSFKYLPSPLRMNLACHNIYKQESRPMTAFDKDAYF